MQVGFRRERDPQPIRGGRRPAPAAGPDDIHRQRPPIPQIGQVGRVPQPFIHDGHDQCLAIALAPHGAGGR